MATGSNTIHNVHSYLAAHPSRMFNFNGADKQSCPLWKNMSIGCQYLFELYKKFGYVTAHLSDADFPGYRVHQAGFCSRLSENLDYLFEVGLCFMGGLNTPGTLPTNEYGIPSMLIGSAGANYSHRNHCLRGQYHHERIHSFFAQLEEAYRNHPKFIYVNTAMTHDYDQQNHRVFDKHLSSFLESVLFERRTRRPLVLLILSDHGIPAGAIYKEPLGEYESALPFLRVVLTKSLFPPIEIPIARKNQKMPTSHYDTFETLRDILRASNDTHFHLMSREPTWNMPGKYFLREGLPDRICSEIGVPFDQCRCEISRADVNQTRESLLINKMISDIEGLFQSKLSKDPNSSDECYDWGTNMSKWNVTTLTEMSEDRQGVDRATSDAVQWKFEASSSLRPGSKAHFRGLWSPRRSEILQVKRTSQYDIETCGILPSSRDWCLCRAVKDTPAF